VVVLPDRGGNQLVATAEAGGKLGARRGMHLIVGASEQPASNEAQDHAGPRTHSGNRQ
jgi:hypothetical protein